MSTDTVHGNEVLVPDSFPMAMPVQNAHLQNVLPVCLEETAVARYESAAARAKLVKLHSRSGVTSMRDVICAQAYANKLGELAIADTPYATVTNEALSQLMQVLSQQAQALAQQMQALAQQMQAIHAEMTQRFGNLEARFGDLEARVLNAAAYDDNSVLRALVNPPQGQDSDH
jgi:hypothetical protein